MVSRCHQVGVLIFKADHIHGHSMRCYDLTLKCAITGHFFVLLIDYFSNGGHLFAPEQLAEVQAEDSLNSKLVETDQHVSIVTQLPTPYLSIVGDRLLLVEDINLLP